MVTRMDALFLVDRDARQQQMSAEERLASRREHAESGLSRFGRSARGSRRRCCRRAHWARRFPTR